MIPKECKRLAEVDFPIAEVSRHAAREKSIRHGHPSTLHLWWARRPLASSLAVLMALLLPVPCDPHCPDEFKSRAKDLLLVMRGRPSKWDPKIKDGEGLRQTSLKFISDFANWDNAAKAANLETGLGPARAAPPGGDTAGGGPLRQRSQPGANERPHDDRGAEPEEASVSSEAVLPEECNGDRNKHDHVE